MRILIERGRGDLALERIEWSWTTWRGRAVEPLVRESSLRLMPGDEWPATEATGRGGRSELRAPNDRPKRLGRRCHLRPKARVTVWVMPPPLRCLAVTRMDT